MKRKALLLGILILGAASLALGAPPLGQGSSAPEIDPGQAISAFALLSGSVLVIRGRRRKA